MISKLDQRNIFLVDGVGALTTALLLGLLLSNFNAFFGVPRKISLILAGIALFFAVYSFLCHFFIREKWRPFLVVISVLNLIYCCITAIIITQLSTEITIWGIVYFTGEITLVASLAVLEIRLAKST